MNARSDIELGFRAASAMGDDLKELLRYIPPSKRGTNLQRIINRMEMRADGIYACWHDALSAPFVDRLALAKELLADTPWAVLPMEPTEAMIAALQSYTQCAGYIEEGYRAMIAEATRKDVET